MLVHLLEESTASNGLWGWAWGEHQGRKRQRLDHCRSFGWWLHQRESQELHQDHQGRGYRSSVLRIVLPMIRAEGENTKAEPKRAKRTGCSWAYFTTGCLYLTIVTHLQQVLGFPALDENVGVGVSSSGDCTDVGSYARRDSTLKGRGRRLKTRLDSERHSSRGSRLSFELSGDRT